ncbi:hybrid sensor histidine kinase/response regulator transcription factor [Arcticibacter svalbardensis]|nr:two-component regulator propeller domain-containing protein [Arcticibacter svalbardensis]
MKTSSAQTLNFKHISYKEGLVQSPISNFLQDNQGFIWFGNLKGLTRYDGYEFKTFIYDEEDKSSISNNRVNVILQDHNKNLWVGTANGLNLYNKNSESFTPIDVLEIKGGRNYISSLAEDSNGDLWVGTFAGIRKLNRRTQKLEPVIKPSQSETLSSKAVFSLFVDQDNFMWVGTKSGLQKFDPKTGKVISLPSSFDVVKDLKVLVTRQDKIGNLWFGTEVSGVFNYQRSTNTLKRYVVKDGDANCISSNWVKDILLYNAHTIWFATRNGISTLNTKNQQFTNYKHDPLNSNSLNDNSIWSFMKDKASCVWVGTFAGGINFYYKGNANFQNVGERVGDRIGLNHVLVNAVSEDKDGSWWIGTFGGGLNHIIRDRKSEYYSVKSDLEGRPSNGIKSLADDGKGNLWIGSLDGLSLFNKRNKSFKYFKFPIRDGKLSEDLINTVLPDGRGAWVGTNGGGLRYVLPDGSSPIFLRKQGHRTGKSKNTFTLSDNFITALIKDEQGNLWIGTQNGLNYFNPKVKGITKLYRKVRNTKFQINSNNVTTLFIDSKRRLWIGTEGGGLNYFDKSTGHFFAISKNLGLGDDMIHTIVEDDSQNLWLSTDLGLYKLKFKSFHLPFKKEDLEITSYTANDGLISNQFSSNAGIRLHTGEILFGGLNGLSLFYPENIIKNTSAPKVALTRILLNNRVVAIGEDAPLTKSILEAQQIIVPHDQSNLSLTFSALNFINPENNQYAYKLEGLPNDKEWQQTGTQRVVNFANVSPGSYLFKVKAANNDKVWSDDIRILKIIVLPPWWLSWWAYLIYMVLTAFISLIIIRFFRNRVRLKRDLYLEHVYNIRREELYQLKLNFFTNISHEIRTPLTLILGPLDKVMRSGEAKIFSKQLILIKNNADRLMKLVSELLDFRKAEEGHLKIHCSEQDIIVFCSDIFESFNELAEDQKISYQFITSSKQLFIYFDEDQLEKVIYNLLTNAFKFTSEKGSISLIIEEDQEGVSIKIVDDGKGIPQVLQPKLFESFFQVDDRGRHNIGSGIGLALSKSIMELHKGRIEVNTETGLKSVTVFTIFLKKGSDHLDESTIVKYHTLAEDAREQTASPDPGLDTSHVEIVHSSARKYTVLVAEDNDEVRGMVVDILSTGYRILQFSCAEDALVYMENEIPDLILSDIMMPGMNGLDFCKVVKLKESTSHIPFVLLTAKASINNQIDGLSIGADAYLFKPFSPQVLELNIKNLLRAQEVTREKFGQRFILQPTLLDVTSPEELFVSKLMSIIQDKMEDPAFDVNELVNEIGMSRTVLYKKVQSITGLPVADLIKQIRLKKAAELFKHTSYSVSEVTYMVGFNDRKYFSKEFKKQFVVPPSEYIQTFNDKVKDNN